MRRRAVAVRRSNVFNCLLTHRRLQGFELGAQLRALIFEFGDARAESAEREQELAIARHVSATDPERTVPAESFALNIAFVAPIVSSSQKANSLLARSASAGAAFLRVMK